MKLLKNKIFAIGMAALLILSAVLLGQRGVPVKPLDNRFVADYADVLDSDTESYIINKNNELYKACGSEIVIVTVKSTGAGSISAYTEELFSKWNVSNRGIVLLMAINDDDYYAVCGTEAETIFSGFLGDMLSYYLEPDFAAKDYSNGARTIFDGIYKEINSGFSNQPIIGDMQNSAYPSGEYNSSYSYDWLMSAVVALVVIVILGVAMFSGRSRRYGGGGTVFVPVPRRRTIWFGGFGGYNSHNRGGMPPSGGVRPGGFGRGSTGFGAGRGSSGRGSSSFGAGRGGSRPGGGAGRR